MGILCMFVIGWSWWKNRRELEEGFGITATDIYGLSEVMGPGVAQECVETKDGLTVWEGGQPLQCVVDVINSCGVPAVYVTNNASRSPQAVSEMLREIGDD